MTTAPATYTTFAGSRRIATGPLLANALAVRKALLDRTNDALLVFDDATGRVVDVDTRGSEADITARLAPVAAPVPDDEPEATGPRGRGRPKLGVVPREVTLLPRHWEWLAAQPGGASVALRKLVEDARRTGGDKERLRQAQARAYAFMSPMAGNLPGFEEATRALFANDLPRMADLTTGWPADVRDYAMQLATVAEAA